MQLSYNEYKYLTERAIAVLKMYPDLGYTPNVGTVAATNEILSHWELLTALPDPYLPDWAESLNTTGKVQLRSQLCTKDGRQRGNARVVSIECNNPIFPKGSVLYRVRTDIGTEMNLLEDEINQMFYIGNYIMKEGQ